MRDRQSVHISTKAGLRMQISGPDKDGERRYMYVQLDRVSAQLLARRLLQLAGNDKEFPDPGMGEDIFADALDERGHEREALRASHRGAVRMVKVSRR